MILNQAADIRRGTNLTDSVYHGDILIWKRSGPSPYVPVPGERHYGIRFKGGYNGLYVYEYLFDAVNKQPAVMDSSGNVSLGGWATAFFVRNNYPCMLRFNGDEGYKLNPADVRYKMDGNASDYNNYLYEGNAMSCFNCHIWMKFYEDAEWYYLEVADSKLDDDFVDYPYIRANGSHADRMYYPLYSGTFDSTGRLRSIGAGRIKNPENGQTLASLVQAAARNGAGWQIKSYAFMLWVESLIVLMFGGYNVTTQTGQAAYDTYQNGWSYNRGQFNYLKSGNYTSVHQTFFCEWLWGGRRNTNQSFDMMTGLYFICYPDSSMWNPHICYKMFPPYSTDGDLLGYDEVPIADFVYNWSANKEYGFLSVKGDPYNKAAAPFYSTSFSGFRTAVPYFQDNSHPHLLHFYASYPDRYLTSSVFYV